MKPPITYQDFEKLDIRIGTVTHAVIPEWSKKLIKFDVDFGPEIGKKTIFSGIKEWYDPNELVGRQFPFLINLEPKKMNGEESQGMMIMADAQKPILFSLLEHVPEATVVR